MKETEKEVKEQKEILKRLKKLEDIEKRLGILEDRIKSLEVESHLGLEDQLFFGLVFSLLLLVITFPSINDMVSLFEDMPLVSSNAFSYAYSIKFVLIVPLVPACICKYYGAIRRSQFAQYQSIGLLLLASFFFVFMIVFVFLGQLLSQIVGENMLPILFFTLILLGLGLGVIEKSVLYFYHSIGQLTLDKYIRVNACLFLLWMGTSFFIFSFTLITLPVFFALQFSFIIFIISLQFQIIRIAITRNNMYCFFSKNVFFLCYEISFLFPSLLWFNTYFRFYLFIG